MKTKADSSNRSLSLLTSSRYSISSAVTAPPSAAAATLEDEDEDVERFTADCMSQFLPNASFPVVHDSRLDLELGEVWNKTTSRANSLWDEEHADEEDDDDSIEEADLTTTADAKPFKQPTPTPEDQISVMQLLAKWDPQNPPRLEEYENRQRALEEFQLWLECEAQQEAVLRYQKVLDSARDRKDYSSLSIVQRQILRWFTPLQEAIHEKQKEYIDSTDHETKPSAKKFGPYICALPPAKLAVIVAHEAVIHAALHKNKSGNSRSGKVPLVSMCKRLGIAVQEEVVVHRVLHQRFKDAQKEMKKRMQKSGSSDSTGFESNISDILKSKEEKDADDTTPSFISLHGLEDEMPSSQDEKQVDNKKAAKGVNITHKWTYGQSHLKSFIEEINKYRPKSKKRRNAANAVRRAKQAIAKDEEWTLSERVQLGAALFQILQEIATVLEDGNETKAFTLSKNWYQKSKLQTIVTMNDRLVKMIVSDKLQSFDATTTRHKPMIVPPRPWTAADKGGYRMLRVDLMRYHGCHTQREALHASDSSTVFDGLNALGRVKWKINKDVLKVAQQCWDEDIPLGDIPSRTDYDVPPEPERPVPLEPKPEKGTDAYNKSVAEYRKYMERLLKHYRIKQKNMVRMR